MKDDIKGKQHLTYDDHDDDDDNAEKEADDKFQGIMTDLVGRIVQSEYEQAWELYFGEGNKYRNWYEGYSNEGNPLEFKKAEEAETQKTGGGARQDCQWIGWMWGQMAQAMCEGKLTIQTVSSSTPSGTVSNPGYKKPFNISHFINPENLHGYKVIIDFSGITIPEHENVTLSVNIDMNLHRKEKVLLCNDYENPLAEPGTITININRCGNWPGGQFNCVNYKKCVELLLFSAVFISSFFL